MESSPPHDARAAGSESWPALLGLGGVAVFCLAAGMQLLRFRQRNGVWLGGFLHQATLGFTWEASVGYGAMFTAAVVAANAGSWWLVGIFAGCGGIVWSACSVRWMRRYRAGSTPASAAAGARATVALSIGLAVLAAALLIVGRL
ncbi:hypothetical protein [Conexibacter woesei]|uniref:Uncharacterized protein n=1 Tax=Conexibacter woesei (strain DSM 14684 / CCUG 47730 / CIP 108061 / JCM 11494 / NBRC 100937 / ID131577) TaxID=469383 RepID=D3F8F8_CONWI|nr:hypothetical protein [Conexibacter woesei]ADB49028.1 hypothetical protein Cwoe_0593 [Conexibacter woesei DSM 14684]